MKATVLIVDDIADNRMVLTDLLEDEGYVLREADDGDTALEVMRDDPPDLVLLDVMMPTIDGVTCCREIRGDPALSHIPIILVTACDAEDAVVAGLDAGANDYVAKPFTGAIVRARVRAALRTKAAQDEVQRLAAKLEEQNARLMHLALHDALTGLPNRCFLRDRLEQAMRRARRDPAHGYAVLFIDLDGFKSINDSLGHAAGDEALCVAADRLRHHLRDVDTVAKDRFDHCTSRLGGDEFVVLLEGVSGAEEVTAVANRLLRALAQPHEIDGADASLTASIGIRVGPPAAQSADDILREADQAMYLAKSGGKARCVVNAAA